MDKIPLSVVVITKNEEDNMHDCMGSVANWADEIVVVDDESTDRTVEIAKEYGATVYHRKLDVEGIHRNWAYAQARNGWVLSLDADEMVSNDLKDEIRELLSNNPTCAGYSIPLRNYLGSYWIKHGGWYPASKLRMFLKDKFKYEEVKVHPRVFLEGDTGYLKKDIVHKGYPDLEHFLGSLNRQTTWEAEKWVETGRKVTMGKAMWRSFDRFFRTYVRKGGFKDGFVGFMVGVFAGLYQVMSYAKYWEIKSGIKNGDIPRDW